jgi:hypothetical protein
MKTALIVIFYCLPPFWHWRRLPHPGAVTAFCEGAKLLLEVMERMN